MRRADIAMYVSKRSGKMQMTWFEPSLDQEQAEALQIDQRMREALAKGHFEVHYQPLVDARRRSSGPKRFCGGTTPMARIWRRTASFPLPRKQA
ncbi:MAG: hypothetical protein IPP45_09645 [Sphingomonadales bacterium]|nr:hypothetical protein [Sphingomonadales bacterium]